MSKRITVTNGKNPIYDIVIESSFEGFWEELKKQNVENRRVCVVTDSHVAELPCLTEINRILEGRCIRQINFIFPAGEENKNLDIVRRLYTTLTEARFDRRDVLIALGGGVVGDLTGFAAATYLRGIDFIQIPTTLLAQVDSSVGGKTGVDFDCYKNMVGAFHMPKLVYMNMTVLQSLDRRIYLSGLGEVIKYGFITDQPFYEWIRKHVREIKEQQPEALEYMVYRSCENKRIVVEEDPTEKGIRALLNFGHTLGHAIEKQAGFSMYHGECVAIGMAAALYLSKEKGYLSGEAAAGGINAIEDLELPVTLQGLDIEEILRATQNDKKMEAGAIKFILLKEIGHGIVDRTVTTEDMRQALEFIGLNGTKYEKTHSVPSKAAQR